MNRNQFVDIARGIGILLVVFGHNPFVLQQKGELFRIIFSFHVPLFFFLSGIFFNPALSLKETLIKKTDSLLKPYFVTSILISLVYMAIKDEHLSSCITGILYGDGRFVKLPPLWFLTHLFAVTIFSWIMTNLLLNRLEKSIFKYATLGVLLVAGIMSITYFWQIDVEMFGNRYTLPGLPFSLDIILVTTFYYMLGYVLSQHVINFKPVFSLFICAFVLFSGCHYFFDKTIDLNLRAYDGFFIPLTESLSGIYIILTLSYYISKNARLSRILSTFGMASLIILVFHSPFQGKGYGLASRFLGEYAAASALTALIIGSVMPVFLWYLLKKYDILSYFYLPVTSRKKAPAAR